MTMMMAMLIQVEPAETDNWTEAQIATSNIPVPGSAIIVVSVFGDSPLGASISGLTADACIHPLRKYCFVFLICISNKANNAVNSLI